MNTKQITSKLDKISVGGSEDSFEGIASNHLEDRATYGEPYYHVVADGKGGLEGFSVKTKEDAELEIEEFHPSTKIFYQGYDFKKATEVFNHVKNNKMNTKTNISKLHKISVNNDMNYWKKLIDEIYDLGDRVYWLRENKEYLKEKDLQELPKLELNLKLVEKKFQDQGWMDDEGSFTEQVPDELGDYWDEMYS